MSGFKGAGETIVRRGWKNLSNAIGRRLWPLEGKALCADARRRTGLEDFGDPPVDPALSILTESLESQGDLHPFGRFLMRTHLRDILETRLRLTEAWSKQLQTLDASPIERPIFITGMPRSGSTFLHELLVEDVNNRAPRVWEVMFPVPAPETGQRPDDARIRKTAACLWWFRRIAPQADSVYPMRACTPHECVAIHSYTLSSEEFASTCRIPTYETFLRSSGLDPVYAWQKRFLQHLQSRCPTKRWVLKSPDHSFGLEELFHIFPDAIVIQTHRNPLEVLKSSTQLTTVLRNLYARPCNRNDMHIQEARLLSDAMERFIRFRDLHPELADRFIDVKYTELVFDPMAVIRRIYQQIDTPLTPATAERMSQLVSNRSRHRGHRTARTLADLGLDVSAETRRFNRYCFRFGIPCQLSR